MNTLLRIIKKIIYRFSSPRSKDDAEVSDYGVMVTGWTHPHSTINIANVGDDIQALATIHTLKKFGITDYCLINREHLKKYIGKKVKMILNGWFMHNAQNFPPSPNIVPICMSIHITPHRRRLIPSNLEFWHTCQSIGCRDTATVNDFKKAGIKSHFSGCMTLMFDRYEGEREGIYLVDCGEKYNRFLATVPYAEEEMIRTQHYLNSKTHPHLLWDAVANNGDTGTNHNLGEAQRLLDLYRKARLIITPLLHCALPARAFGTPVLFINKMYATDARFKGLEHILKGSNGSIPFSKLDPNIDYRIIKEAQQRIEKDLGRYIKPQWELV